MANAYPRLDRFSRWVSWTAGLVIIVGGSAFAIWLGKQAWNEQSWIGVIFSLGLGVCLVSAGWRFANRAKPGLPEIILWALLASAILVDDLNKLLRHAVVYDKWGRLASDGLLTVVVIGGIVRFFYQRKNQREQQSRSS